MAVCVVWQNFLVWRYSVGGIGSRAAPHSHYQAGCQVVACIFSNPQSKCAHAKFCGRLCLCADKNMAQCVSTGFSKSRRARGWWNAFPRPDSNLNSNDPLLPSLAFTQQAKTNILIQCIPEWSYPEHFILKRRGCMISPVALLNSRLTHVNVARGSQFTSQEYFNLISAYHIRNTWCLSIDEKNNVSL